MPTGIEVREATGPDGGVIEALVEVADAIDAEVSPGDPPNADAELAARHFGFTPDHPTRTWVAWLHGQPAGWAVAELSETGENPTVAEVEVEVHPARRAAGVGRALAGALLAGLRDGGRTSVIAWCSDARGSAFAERLGLTHRQDERCSRLLVAEVDDAQQQAWLAAPEAVAAGYQVVSWDESGCPDGLLDAYLVACQGMDDAPLDAIEWTPEHPQADQLRAQEAARRRRGHLSRTSLALAADGSPAGATDLMVHRARPAIAEQGDTAVLAQHRGHGLGRWLKAENLRAARAAWPEMAVVETYNAESNPWMLAINVAMGFHPHRTYRAYQGPVATALDLLG